MKIVLLISVIVGVTCGFQQTLPDSAGLDLQSSGAKYLGDVITQQNEALTNAVEEFKPINASCMAKYDEALASCGSCVNDKCVARAKSVCKPSDWELILGGAINFITDDVPDFFSDTVPDFFEHKVGGAFVDLGGEIVDITKDIGDFFEQDVANAFVSLGGEIEDTASDVGKFVENVAGDIGDAFEDLGDGIVDAAGEVAGVIDDIGDAFEDLGDGIVDVAGEIGNVAENVGGEIGNVAENVVGEIGDFFEGLLGRRRRRRSLRARRSAEPGCSAIKDDSAEACKFYLSPDYCSDCGFSTAQDCPGYDAAVEKIKAASAAREWMDKATSSSYRIVKTTFSPFDVDIESQGFNGVVVEVHIFGLDLQFTVSQPINPYSADVAGPVIAAQALQLFQSS